MKTARMLTICVMALGLVFFPAKPAGAAPMGTAFTYQGHLYDANYAANGLYDFAFKLYDASVGGGKVGTDVNVADVNVIDAYFTVELDFGSSVFDGNAVWLEIGVRPGDLKDPNVYTVLEPRQEITPTPYAFYAKSAQTAGSDNDWMISGNDMYSIPSGNIGIGTDTPEAALEIVGEGIANHLMLTNLGSPGPALRLNALNKDWVIIGTSPGASSGDQQLIFRDHTAAEDRMAIDRYGNVGIGTTHPTCTFDVTGTQDSNLVSQPNATHMFIHLTNTTENIGEGPGIGFSNSNVKENIGAKIVHIRTGSQSTGDLVFYTKNSGTQGDYTTEKMRIKANGNVGIGTTSPASKLDILGDSRFSGDVYTSGNIGIGATIPKSKLSIGSSGSSSYNLYVGTYNTYGIYTADSYYGLYGSGTANGIWAHCYDDSGSNTGLYAVGGSNGTNSAKAISARVYRDGSGTYHSGYFMDSGSGGTYNGLYADVRTGGAIDLAEYILDTLGDTEAGDVLVADPHNKESVLKSSTPYDTSVVGVVSTQPHLLMGMELVMDEESGEMYEDVNATKLALAGRVPTKVTDENGPVRIGDLLTTSSKPGYAMKWTALDVTQAEDFEELKQILSENQRRQNAIVGRALEPLNGGEGKIMALVNSR